MDKSILKETLHPKNVAERKGAGNMKLSYIESHHAIREANRAFDYDGWQYETKNLTCVSTTQNQNQNHVVSYTSIVTVKVHTDAGWIIREDVGFGQGIDRDLGKAHEGATKEAVSDAQKRCLRTFGDIFGLALYDKTQAHVGIPEEKDLLMEYLSGKNINVEAFAMRFNIKNVTQANALMGDLQGMENMVATFLNEADPIKQAS